MAQNTAGLKRGGSPGRPAGVPNKKNRDIADAYEKILTDPKYRDSLKRRLIRGTATAMEVTMHHYVYGKPKETVAHEGLTPANEMTDDALRAALADLSALLQR